MASPDPLASRPSSRATVIHRPAKLSSTVISECVASGNSFQVNGPLNLNECTINITCPSGESCISRLGNSHGRSASFDGSTRVAPQPTTASRRRYTDPAPAHPGPRGSDSGTQGSSSQINGTSTVAASKIMPQVSLFGTTIATPISNPTVEGNWMSMRLIKRNTSRNLRMQVDVAKRKATYGGQELTSTGHYIDMRCKTAKLDSRSTCVHRFYLVHGPPFDILLGSETGCTVL
ncbi:hypothetical protein CC79DRAFT_524593 [Sarocladium strictum]